MNGIAPAFDMRCSEPHPVAFDHNPDTYLSLWRGSISKPAARVISMRGIRLEVENAWNLNPGELFSESRQRHVARARHDFMWRCRQIRWADGTHRHSYPQIGLYLGGMHHTSVMHGDRQHAKRLGGQLA